MAISVAGALIAAGIAYSKYIKANHVPVSDTVERGSLAKLSYHKYYIDEIYSALITKPLDALSGFFFQIVDKSVIDGIVNGIGNAADRSSKRFRLLQTGNVGFYIFMMVLSIVAMLLYSFYKI